MIIMKYHTVIFNDCLFHCGNFSEYLKKLYNAVSIRESNMKIFTFTSTIDTHEVPKNQISSLSLNVNSKEIKPVNFKLNNYLRLSFLNIPCLSSNHVMVLVINLSLIRILLIFLLYVGETWKMPVILL